MIGTRRSHSCVRAYLRGNFPCIKQMAPRLKGFSDSLVSFFAWLKGCWFPLLRHHWLYYQALVLKYIHTVDRVLHDNVAGSICSIVILMVRSLIHNHLSNGFLAHSHLLQLLLLGCCGIERLIELDLTTCNYTSTAHLICLRPTWHYSWSLWTSSSSHVPSLRRPLVRQRSLTSFNGDIRPEITYLCSSSAMSGYLSRLVLYNRLFLLCLVASDSFLIERLFELF